jgi:hypothetical protein
MLCTAIYDAYTSDERDDAHQALVSLLGTGQPDWSPQGSTPIGTESPIASSISGWLRISPSASLSTTGSSATGAATRVRKSTRTLRTTSDLASPSFFRARQSL